ncbi:actin cytoskeleton-regulatory complex protein PAN1 isoform X1 [Syzygium oleosum]|uniref:actin cytoskeleton-regulatory complex protein PAN1 isoform X1 n=1 Tax=Syzygium oleosum TaxID=219896 RepID=UPI0011D236B3|nr:actin cytoskeleton-regulatory complex protein PAN1 isoform X1 [Syzygium oleosum]
MYARIAICYLLQVLIRAKGRIRIRHGFHSIAGFFLGQATNFEAMKQETPPRATPAVRAECRTSGNSISHSSATTPSRFRATPKVKESLKAAGDVPRDRAKSVPPDVKNDSKAQRSLVLRNPKSGDVAAGSQKGRELEEAKIGGRARAARTVVEQFARPRRLRPGVSSVTSRRNEDGVVDGNKKKREELQEKFELNENLVKSLQSEVLALKVELEKALSLNGELESKNRKLTEDLAAAEHKIATLSSFDQRESTKDFESPKFKDIQKLIANKLDNSKVKKEAFSEAIFKTTLPAEPASSIPRVIDNNAKPPPCPSLPPPPPPPLPSSRSRARGSATPKTPAVVEFYRLLTKPEEKKDESRSKDSNKPAVTSAHSSIVGEIQNRSAHLLAIKADIETKGEFVNGLIQKIQAAAFSDIEEVLNFVDWLDNELSSLADERAVLKHFNWPEKKADAMREAAVEYRTLKLLESEIYLYEDDMEVPCGSALKKMAGLLDKSERGIQKLVKLRSSVMRSYQNWKIPTDWMLDSGMVYKIKQVSMKLATMYMKRVTTEFESMRNSDRESTQEALLLQGVHFAYRAHQFAGGLDSETLCAFEEIRHRIPGHFQGSQHLLAGITSS